LPPTDVEYVFEINADAALATALELLDAAEPPGAAPPLDAPPPLGAAPGLDAACVPGRVAVDCVAGFAAAWAAVGAVDFAAVAAGGLRLATDEILLIVIIYSR
jgi:hypothetical protein